MDTNSVTESNPLSVIKAAFLVHPDRKVFEAGDEIFVTIKVKNCGCWDKCYLTYKGHEKSIYGRIQREWCRQDIVADLFRPMSFLQEHHMMMSLPIVPDCILCGPTVSSLPQTLSGCCIHCRESHNKKSVQLAHKWWLIGQNRAILLDLWRLVMIALV
jgi:hypothetical protein